MRTSLKALFTEHPHSVGESYGQHFAVALSYSGRLFVASAAAFVHGFLPFLCVRTASTAVERMHANMKSRTRSGLAPAREAGFQGPVRSGSGVRE